MDNRSIGATLCIVGGLSITLGLNLQKHVHNTNTLKVSYVRLKLWWMGVFLMALGELGNFMAYGYASATVVAPLGCVNVICNAFVSHLVLKEPLTLMEVIGLFLAIAGSVSVVMNAPTSLVHLTMANFLSLVERWEFLLFLGLVIVAFTMLLFLPLRLKQRYVVYYVLMCSLLGSVTVMCTEGLSSAVVLTVSGDNQFSDWLPWVLLIVAACTVFLQLRYLNCAMGCFGASQVVPVYYVLFSLCAIATGIVLLEEDHQPHMYNSILFAAGCLTTFVGVYLITRASVAPEGHALFENETTLSLGSRKRSSGEISDTPSDLRVSLPRTPLPSREGSWSRKHPATPPSVRRLASCGPSAPLLGALTIDLVRRWRLGLEGDVLEPGPPSFEGYRYRASSLPGLPVGFVPDDSHIPLAADATLSPQAVTSPRSRSISLPADNNPLRASLLPPHEISES